MSVRENLAGWTCTQLLAASAPVQQPLVTGTFTVVAALGGVALTHWFSERRLAAERAAAAEVKVEEGTRELIEAVGELQLALAPYLVVHNSWRSG